MPIGILMASLYGTYPSAETVNSYRIVASSAKKAHSPFLFDLISVLKFIFSIALILTDALGIGCLLTASRILPFMRPSPTANAFVATKASATMRNTKDLRRIDLVSCLLAGRYHKRMVTREDSD